MLERFADALSCIDQCFIADDMLHHRSVHDRRSVHIRLTEKGQSLRDGLVGMHIRHVSVLPDAGVDVDDLQTVAVTLLGLQRFWNHTGVIQVRRSPLAA